MTVITEQPITYKALREDGTGLWVAQANPIGDATGGNITVNYNGLAGYDHWLRGYQFNGPATAALLFNGIVDDTNSHSQIDSVATDANGRFPYKYLNIPLHGGVSASLAGAWRLCQLNCTTNTNLLAHTAVVIGYYRRRVEGQRPF